MSFIIKVALASVVLLLAITVVAKSVWADIADDPSGPIVELPGLGSLLGSVTYGRWTNKTIHQFLGIRYAKSPSGLRRFKVRLNFWVNVTHV